MRLKRSDLQVCLLLIVATLGVYGQMGNHDFISLDDNLYVTDNIIVQGGLTLKGVIWAFTNTSQAGLWIPLTWLSLMLDHDLYGLNAGGYKITNLMFHLANILLLYIVLKKMTGKIWQCAFVAALFALHPLRVESVAWVTERKDVLSALFWMLTLWFYLRYVELPGIRRYLPAFLAFALGLMAKPMLVTLPLVMLLLDYWPLNRFRQPPAPVESKPSTKSPSDLVPPSFPAVTLLVEKLPMFFLAIVVGVGTFLAELSVIPAGTAGGVLSLESIPLKFRIANGLLSSVSYIGKMFWPHSLGVLYPHPGISLPIWQAGGAGLLLVVISLLAIYVHRRHPYLLVGWLWYLVTLLPVIGLVQVGPQAMADRFTYVPLIGIFIMIAWGGADLLSGWRHRRMVLSLLATVTIFGSMAVSWLQVNFWANSRTLYEHTLTVTEDNYLIQNNLGVVLLESGRIDEAISCFLEALKIAPDFVLANYNMGLALAQQGKTQEAVSYYSKALRIKPEYSEAHNSLGHALAVQGNIPAAVQHFSEALRIRPDYAEAHNNLGHALADQGNIPQAVQHYSEAIKIKPDYAEAHNNLGIVLAKQGKLPEAISHFSEALRLEPDFVEADMNLRVARGQQGKP